MNGILLIDKPTGWTSMDVCAKLRGALHEKRVGHSGTLDPMATGLLAVFLGRATRAVEFAEAAEKEYLAGLRLGVTTDTQDTSGSVLEQRDADVSDAALDAALARFRGEIDQLPPMYSAIKIGGKKLYEIARRGGEVERKPRRVAIYELQRLGRDDAGDIQLRVRCSKGTYIRALCNDIGAALGCGGCMSALRRTRAGEFTLAEAHTMDDVLTAAEEGRAEGLLLPVDTLFRAYPALALTAPQERALRSGVRYTCPLPEGNVYRLCAPDGAFLALGEVREGKMCSRKNFFEN